MDPDSNLENQIDIANDILNGNVEEEDLADDAAALAELVVALDEWLRRGGALPSSWDR